MEYNESCNSLEDLECWRACTEVRSFISELSNKYPKEEKYALIDDMERAASSTTSYIAEGFGRFQFQESMQFCQVSQGLLFELIDQLITSMHNGYITSEEYEKGRSLISKALPLLDGYIDYLACQR